MYKYLLLFCLALGFFQTKAQVACIDSTLINPTAICPLIYNPVCGCDGITYPNDCVATNLGGVTSYTLGACPASSCTANATYVDSGCDIFFNASTSIIASGDSIVSYIWDFGDFATGTSTTPYIWHTYAANGTYAATVTIVTATGCTSIYTLLVNVTGCTSTTCNAAYTFTTNGCNLSLNASSSIGGGAVISQYVWSFGNGNVANSTASTYNYSYTANGVYPVTLVIYTAAGCIDSITQMVTITNCTSTTSCSALATYMPDSSTNCTMNFNASSSTSTAGNIVTYVWDFGDGSIPSTTTTATSSHQYPANGTYTVCVGIFTTSGCYDSTCYIVNVTNCTNSLNDKNLNGVISISPNPVTNQLNVNIVSDKSENIRFSVFNITGENVYSSNFDLRNGTNALKVNTSNFANGIYFVKVESNEGVGIKKFIKK